MGFSFITFYKLCLILPVIIQIHLYPYISYLSFNILLFIFQRNSIREVCIFFCRLFFSCFRGRLFNMVRSSVADVRVGLFIICQLLKERIFKRKGYCNACHNLIPPRVNIMMLESFIKHLIQMMVEMKLFIFHILYTSRNDLACFFLFFYTSLWYYVFSVFLVKMYIQ